MKGKFLIGAIACMAVFFATACKANLVSRADSSGTETEQKNMEAPAVEGDIPLDEVHFPGRYFREYLGRAYDEDSDGVLSQGETEKITKIRMEWEREKYDSESLDITGIQHFKNVRTVYLDMWGFLTGAEEIAQLPSLKKLTVLGIHHELPVYRTASLEVLKVSGDMCIKKLDVSFLPNLKTLKVNAYEGTAWFRLKKYDKKYLIREHLDVSANKRLETLECSGLGLKSLDVSRNPRLRILRCNTNQLKKIKLPAKAELEVLECKENYLTKLDFGHAGKLRVLTCPSNRFRKLNLGKNILLEELECSKNRLKTLDLSKNIKIKELVCAENKLQTLDVSMLKNLDHLECQQNKIIKLQLEQNLKLYCLECYKNRISRLDLSRNPKLFHLCCYQNKIFRLDLKKNPDLGRLSCGQNRISRLDLSHNRKLYDTTEIAENNMTYINLPPQMITSTDPYYTWLNIQGNRFQTIDIRSVKKLNKVRRKIVQCWVTGEAHPKYAEKITVKTLIASKKLSKSEHRFIRRLGRKYKLTVKFV